MKDIVSSEGISIPVGLVRRGISAVLGLGVTDRETWRLLKILAWYLDDIEKVGGTFEELYNRLAWLAQSVEMDNAMPAPDAPESPLVWWAVWSINTALARAAWAYEMQEGEA